MEKESLDCFNKVIQVCDDRSHQLNILIIRPGNSRRLRSFFALLAFRTRPARPLGRQPGRLGTESRRSKRLLDLPALGMTTDDTNFVGLG